MEARRWSEVVATFDEVVELEPDARRQRLSAIGESDAELRQSVEDLLVADAQADDRLSMLDQALTPRPVRRERGRDADPLQLAGRPIGRFRVIEPLAYGGMGVVYRAEDTRLKREVALKFLLPALQSDRSDTQRFLREASVAASLDHPNLCAIHEVGETDDGQVFFAMPLYGGETLKERLLREGALPIADALDIAKQVARGLAAAHAAGIVHRDLKPANVMLVPDGQVKILDFGLATHADVTLTDPFTTRGTVSYMAPEQIQGHALDHRADLWALGVVLYEMLTGQRPFQGEQAITVAHAIVYTEPDIPSSLREDVPPGVDAVVRTLLNKDRARRYTSGADVTAALDARLTAPEPVNPAAQDGEAKAKVSPIIPSHPRGRARLTRRLAIWGAATVMIFLGGFTVSGALGFGPAGSMFAKGAFSASDSLVVADFDVYGPDPSLGRTIASMVGLALSQSNVITIVPDSMIRTALQRMRKSTAAPLVTTLAREVAQREGFRAVVEGELSALGNGVVVTVRIMSPEGDPLVSVYETTTVEDLPDRMDRLTRRLRGRIGESLKHMRASPPLPQVTSHSIEALRKYAEGQRALAENDWIQAVALLNEAIEFDSTFATAWVALFTAYFNGRYPLERWDYALERAWRNRDRLPERERYRTEAAYFRYGPGLDRVRAKQAYEAGLRIDSGAFANGLGLVYQSQREFAKAESLFRWYVSRGSTQPAAYENLSNALYFQGKREEAESVARETARRFPTPKQWIRTANYVYNRGQLDSAQLMLERAREAASRDATLRRISWLQRSDLHAMRGASAQAERARREAAEANVERGFSRDSVSDQLWLVSFDIWQRARPDNAARKLDRLLARTPLTSLPFVSPVLFEPYYLLVARRYAEARRPSQARALMDAFAADGRDTIEKRRSQPIVHAVRGEIALAEGRPMDALDEFRRADRMPDGPVHMETLGLHANVGRAFDQAGMADSAIASFEKYLDTPQLNRTGYDAIYLAHILQRLGALHDAKGERERAITYYTRFVELWRNADAELQPRVVEARQRIASGAVATRASSR